MALDAGLTLVLHPSLTWQGGAIRSGSYDQFVLSLGVPLGWLRPGISVRLPLDDPLATIESASLGLSLGVDLGRGRR